MMLVKNGAKNNLGDRTNKVFSLYGLLRAVLSFKARFQQHGDGIGNFKTLFGF